MKRNHKNLHRDKIFFAYQSPKHGESSDNVDAIRAAIKILKSGDKLSPYSWEELKNNGRIVIKSICDAIDSCNIFACDISYMNHNVLFELGYAIAKNKRLFILLNENINRSSINFNKIDILKNVGYSKFRNANDIVNEIDKISKEPQLLKDLSLTEILITHDIFYISNSSNTQSELDIQKLLNESKYSILFDATSESEYRSLHRYFQSILSANYVIVHITNTYCSDSFEENAKASLFAGFSLGMKKGVLLIAPMPYSAPIDYVDIMIKYNNANQCIIKLNDWLKKNVILNKIPDYQNNTELDVLKLGLGYDIAENEKDKLEKYFVETPAYEFAQNNKRTFFVGRKGTGKTAIYIMLFNKLLLDNKNYIVALKPESSELFNNIETAVKHDSVAQKQSFFHTIWRFVIYAKLMIEISSRITAKRNENEFYELSVTEEKILEFVESNNDILQKYFFEIIEYIDNKEVNILQNINIKFINPMVKLLVQYFSIEKYFKISVIADNLDKTWDIRNNLHIQTEMLLSLFEVTGNIEHELQSNSKNIIEINVILFLRKDIFEFVLREAREPDKLILSRHEIDWSNFPELLKILLEKRFAYVLNLKNNTDITAVWKKYFNIKQTSDPFIRIKEACLPRPRDLLMFIRCLFESAVNSGHTQIIDDDFSYALKEYSDFLYQNLVAEMASEFPDIRSILEHLHSKYLGKIELGQLIVTLKELLSDDIDIMASLVDTLISNGYFEIINERTGKRYKKFQDANDSYLEDAFYKIFCFRIRKRRQDIFAILSPQYSRLTR